MLTIPADLLRYSVREGAIRRDCRQRPGDEPPRNGRLCCIIPSYNYGQYIATAIDSVLAQTRQADEIIVIDDGSTDDTMQRLEWYRGAPRLRVVLNSDNLGLAATRNRAINLTAAEYIVCIDADDWADPAYFERMTEALDNDPALGVVYSSVQAYDEATQEYRSHPKWPPQFRWDWVTVRDDGPPRTMIPSSAMYRREMWRRCGGFIESYTRAEDAEFWVRGLSTGWTVHKVTDERLYSWRSHGDNLSYWGEVPDVWANLPFIWRNDAPMNAPTDRAKMKDYTDPAISVVITIGPGHGKYAASAIESVLAQTFWNWQLVIVNDSGEKIDFIRYPFAKVFATDGGKGASYARNLGVTWADAPFVLFLDGDDWLHPFALQKLATKWLEVGRGFVYSDLFEYVSTGRDDVRKYKANIRELSEYRTDSLTMQCGITSLMLTSDARKAEFDEDMRDGWEDVDYYNRLRLAGVCGTRLAEPLYYYRVQAGTLRKRAADNKDKLDALLKSRYGKYNEGGIIMAPCCGGDSGTAIVQLKRSMNGLPDLPSASTPTGKTRMRFIGQEFGEVTYLGKYVAADNDISRYVDVEPNDVQRLEQTGKFVVVDTPRVVEPATFPIVATEPVIEVFGPPDDTSLPEMISNQESPQDAIGVPGDIGFTPAEEAKSGLQRKSIKSRK